MQCTLCHVISSSRRFAILSASDLPEKILISLGRAVALAACSAWTALAPFHSSPTSVFETVISDERPAHTKKGRRALSIGPYTHWQA